MLHSFLTSALYGDEWSDSLPGHLASWKEPEYPLTGGLAGRQSQSERYGGDKNIFLLLGDRTPDRSSCSLIITPASRLL